VGPAFIMAGLVPTRVPLHVITRVVEARNP
jgi:hypothetical protein